MSPPTAIRVSRLGGPEALLLCVLVRGAGNAGVADELYARVEAAAAGTPYRTCRTEGGFDPTVDGDVPQRQELLTRRRVTQVRTYRVVLHPGKKIFTLTDVVRNLVAVGGVCASPL